MRVYTRRTQLYATVSPRISNDFNYNFVIAASHCFNKSVGNVSLKPRLTYFTNNSNNIMICDDD